MVLEGFDYAILTSKSDIIIRFLIYSVKLSSMLYLVFFFLNFTARSFKILFY